jgi:hypothetical protein
VGLDKDSLRGRPEREWRMARMDMDSIRAINLVPYDIASRSFGSK